MRVVEYIKTVYSTSRKAPRLRRMYGRMAISSLALISILLLRNIGVESWVAELPLFFITFHFALRNIPDAMEGRAYLKESKKVLGEMHQALEKMQAASSKGNFWEWSIHQKRFTELLREIEHWELLYNGTEEQDQEQQ